MRLNNPDSTQSKKDEDTFELIDSELIGIVYEVAFDPHFWPDLLENITRLFDINQQTANELSLREPKQLISGEQQRFTTLVPHLYKALKLKRNYNETDHTRGQAQAILDNFPIGVILVKANGKLVSANQPALALLEKSQAILIKDDILCAAIPKQDQHLKDCISKVAYSSLEKAGNHLNFIKLNANDHSSPISLLISPDPYPGIEYDEKAENYAAIFIASTSLKQSVSESTLQTVFGLTPAEARLAALLTCGDSLTQAAEHSHISKNTAKVQLKSIFLKMDITRQADLIKKILMSPAVLNSVNNTANESVIKTDIKPKSHVNNEETIILQDGRPLHYAEFGDPGGKPVIHLHGILGCRYERLLDDALTTKLGIRLIIPDRPGYGFSRYAPDQGYLELADDILALIDHLGIKKISIMGHSVGAIYGSAFAFKYPERLHHLAMISSTPPFRSFADFTGIPASLKLLIAFSKYLPSVAQLITETAIKNACNNPKKFIANIPIGAYDQAIFAQPVLRDHIEFCLLTGSKNNQFGFVHDILLSAKPWPFNINKVQTKIGFWHGTVDSHSPVTRINPIIEMAINKNVRIIDGAGHFLIYEYWQEIIESLI